ncbi:MAG: hypothetical protein IH987_00465 [Planctomycetes bacterium]|nr:hypothetical protein [Planctomycetota bacterium]
MRNRTKTQVLLAGAGVAVVIVLLTVVGAVGAGDAQRDGVNTATGATPQALEKLSRLSWMHGEWISKQDGDTLHETWSAPHGDSMMGMFRWIKGDKVWIFELITITADGNDVVFRLKHFSRGMVGWEEKDESLTAKLTHLSENKVIFDGERKGKPLRFTYERQNGDLVIRIGKDSPTELRFQRHSIKNGAGGK